MKNVPNILTIIRIILIPFFVFLFFSDLPHNMSFALVIFIIAGMTDVLDGFIARRFNLVSDVGKVLDPLADKMMLLSVLICLTSTGLVPLWILILIMLKEMVMIYGGVYLYFSNTQIIIPSNKYGKLGTLMFYFAIFLVLIHVNKLVTTISLYLAVLLAVIAFFNYLKIALKMRKTDKENI